MPVVVEVLGMILNSLANEAVVIKNPRRIQNFQTIALLVTAGLLRRLAATLSPIEAVCYFWF